MLSLRSRRAGALAVGLVLAVAIGAAGCGRSVGTVTGKVTYKGQPLKGGVVSFTPADGKGPPVPATIAEDGSYTAEKVPTGEMHVTVDNSNLKPPPDVLKGGGPPKYQPPPEAPAGVDYKPPDVSGNAARYTPIPEKYASPDETPLKVTVKTGTQTFPIDLAD